MSLEKPELPVAEQQYQIPSKTLKVKDEYLVLKAWRRKQWCPPFYSWLCCASTVDRCEILSSSSNQVISCFSSWCTVFSLHAAMLGLSHPVCCGPCSYCKREEVDRFPVYCKFTAPVFTVWRSDTFRYLCSTLAWLLSEGLCFVNRPFQVVELRMPETSAPEELAELLQDVFVLAVHRRKRSKWVNRERSW